MSIRDIEQRQEALARAAESVAEHQPRPRFLLADDGALTVDCGDDDMFVLTPAETSRLARFLQAAEAVLV